MNASLAVQLLLGLLAQAQGIGAMIAKAQAEGRDVTSEELDALMAADDRARAQLQAAIDAKVAGG